MVSALNALNGGRGVEVQGMLEQLTRYYRFEYVYSTYRQWEPHGCAAPRRARPYARTLQPPRKAGAR